MSTLAKNVPESSTDVFHGTPGIGEVVNRGAATIVGGRITQGFSYLYTGLYLGQTETTAAPAWRRRWTTPSSRPSRP